MEYIHGFGFLSENSKFAKICEESNIRFIGPSYKVIEKMGNKSKAKEMFKNAGIPVIPGSDGAIENIEEAKKISKKIGYPIMLKAANGGGGKGIRIVNSEEELEENYNIVKHEAKISFSDDEIYIEKYILNPRHIEIQILADKYGNIVQLGERDCTIQRKNQKILEETPSIAIDDKTRNKLGEIAIKVAKVAEYTNAGTVEFLVDKNKNFYFMEMNTRIQVEHPITEENTGIDLIKEQIRIAADEQLRLKQNKIIPNGHSIECRINAENPFLNFRPSPGKITGLHLPGGNGIRIDTAIYEGYEIPSTYDSMIAKLIAHGNSRNEAIAKMKRALEELVIDGIDTNVDFLLKVITNLNFIRGNYDTSFIEKEILKGSN
mgnify:CR=1 FL=1